MYVVTMKKMGKGEVEDRYTQDGTTDLKGNPCVKKETGTWKACPYILGMQLRFMQVTMC